MVTGLVKVMNDKYLRNIIRDAKSILSMAERCMEAPFKEKLYLADTSDIMRTAHNIFAGEIINNYHTVTGDPR